MLSGKLSLQSRSQIVKKKRVEILMLDLSGYYNIVKDITLCCFVVVKCLLFVVWVVHNTNAEIYFSGGRCDIGPKHGFVLPYFVSIPTKKIVHFQRLFGHL